MKQWSIWNTTLLYRQHQQSRKCPIVRCTRDSQKVLVCTGSLVYYLSVISNSCKVSPVDMRQRIAMVGTIMVLNLRGGLKVTIRVFSSAILLNGALSLLAVLGKQVAVLIIKVFRLIGKLCCVALQIPNTKSPDHQSLASYWPALLCCTPASKCGFDFCSAQKPARLCTEASPTFL